MHLFMHKTVENIHFSLFMGLVLTQTPVCFYDFLEGGHHTHSLEIPIKSPPSLLPQSPLKSPAISRHHDPIKSGLPLKITQSTTIKFHLQAPKNMAISYLWLFPKIWKFHVTSLRQKLFVTITLGGRKLEIADKNFIYNYTSNNYIKYLLV